MNSYSRTQMFFGALVALAIVAGIGYVFWQGAHKPGFGGEGAATTTTGTTTMQVSPTTVIVTTPGGSSYSVSQVPIANPPAVPAYKGTIVCPAGMPQEQCASIQSKDAAVIGKLQTKPTDASAWLQLGTLRKEAGDYQGATVAWDYFVALYPMNSAGYFNLADLYMNFVKDYPKAEANFLLAAKYAPGDTSIYADLFTLYTTTSYVPSHDAAENILKKGIAANPNAVNLQVTLARYYKSAGRATDAKAEYDAAIANAQAQGQTALAAQIQSEEQQ
jgi:tetratricopeptide (TPR) repeat protein